MAPSSTEAEKTQPRAAEGPEPAVAAALLVVLDLPPKGVEPNARVHWSVRARAVKRQREEAAYAFRPKRDERGRLARALLSTPTVLHAKFYTGRHARLGDRDGFYRPKDRDNALASLKASIDGIVDARVIPDDRAETLRIGEVEIVSEGPPRLVLTLTEARP